MDGISAEGVSRIKQLGESITGVIVKIKNGKPTVIVIDGERYVLEPNGGKK